MKFEIWNSYIEITVDDVNEEELCIDNIFVKKEDRGQGIGRQLIAKAIEYAVEQGKNIWLYAEPQTDNWLDGEALIEFYRSCWFLSDGDCNELMTYTI